MSFGVSPVNYSDSDSDSESLCLGIFLTSLIHILHVQVFVLQIFFTGRNMSYGRHITDQYSYTTSWFQCWSILVLKAFTSFAATTRSGIEMEMDPQRTVSEAQN